MSSAVATTGRTGGRPAPARRSRALPVLWRGAVGVALWGFGRLLPDQTALLGLGRTALEASPLLGTLGFVLGGAALTAVGLSRQAVALVGGYLFGAAFGTPLALGATLAGSAAAYGLAARLGRDGIERRWPTLGARLREWTRDDAFAKVLMLRLLPIGSNLVTNLAAGVARAPFAAFLAASLVGFLPQTLVFALAGHGVGEVRAAPVLLGTGLLGASTALAGRIARRHRRRVGDDAREREGRST